MPNHKDSIKSPENTLGKIMIIGTWIIVLLFLTLYFDDQIEQMFNPNTSPESGINAAGANEVTLHRNQAGHYIVSGHINHQTVQFMVDTGASDVAVPAALAEKLGLKKHSPVIYKTANGLVNGHSTRLDSIGLGNITLENIRGGINPGMTGELVLLGMSFLKHVEIVQRNQTLIIRHHQ